MKTWLWWHQIKKGYILKAREDQFKATKMVKAAVRKEKRTRKSYNKFKIKIISLGSAYQESRCLRTIHAWRH
jgi:hypothetical protein